MKKIGIIGVGGIANVHIRQLLEVKDCEIAAICDINPERLEIIGEKLKIPKERRFAYYRDLIACKEVDAVEICTPNYLHIPMAAAAAKAGKPFNLEKPLSTCLGAAEPLVRQLKETPVANMMCFSYRFMPAVRYAKWIMEKGLIGDVVSVDVAYLKASAFMEGRRLDWRFVKEYAGTGVLGDLGVHLIDMAEFLMGEIREVTADCKIVVKQRKRLDSEELADVETDDYCSFLARLGKDTNASFVITRCAYGNANTIKFDLYGTAGVISFDLNQPEILKVCVGEIDLKSEALHTVKVPAQFHITQEQMFVDLLHEKECQYLPTVKDGLRCQKILDSILLSSKERRWVTI